MKKYVEIFYLFLVGIIPVASAQQKPMGLMTDLIEHTGIVFVNGYSVGSLADWERNGVDRPVEIPLIRSGYPVFGWIVEDERPNVRQTAYHILLSDNEADLTQDKGNIWDSGIVTASSSVNVPYTGKKLQPSETYYWKVRTYNNGTQTPWSKVSLFRTAEHLDDYGISVYPLQKSDENPSCIERVGEDAYFLDFGRAAFGQLTLDLYTDTVCTISVHLGEALRNGRIDREPGGTIRYAEYKIQLQPGMHTYRIDIRRDTRNTGPAAILMPLSVGEVYPFRYCEVEGYTGKLQPAQVRRNTVHHPFNVHASYFTSSDTVLNKVWDMMKYTVKATSFTGKYIDGDRERIPYEADALINQLCHYCTDREYTMARNTHEYLLRHATWPTEWSLQTIQIAWYDYLYTGDKRSLENNYEILKNKTLSALARQDGLISTEHPQTPEFLASIGLKDTKLKDIVDWPHTGILGLGKNEAGETDGFDFKSVNTVVNAFYYRALDWMAQIASALGEEEDARLYRKQAEKVKTTFNKKLLRKGIYVDGEASLHSSLHANMFPLAFGIVPEHNKKEILRFIRSRRMACSVYGAQFLLDALYEAGDAEYALQLLTSTEERSWYNMHRVGSTIALEAWDNKYKPNQDWNHAWGAAPANIIPRKLMGIEPLTPGFEQVRIKPQPATLSHATILHPTVRGTIEETFDNQPGQRFEMTLTLPANTEAIVMLPLTAPKYRLYVNGKKVSAKVNNGFVEVEKIGSGKHTFLLEMND